MADCEIMYRRDCRHCCASKTRLLWQAARAADLEAKRLAAEAKAAEEARRAEEAQKAAEEETRRKEARTSAHQHTVHGPNASGSRRVSLSLSGTG